MKQLRIWEEPDIDLYGKLLDEKRRGVECRSHFNGEPIVALRRPGWWG